MVAPPCALAASARDPICAPLRAFASSVAPGQTQTVEFHTVWGGDFKSVAARSLYAKRCMDHGYQPATALCSSLMQHGAIEFSGNNAKRAVACLSPSTRFASPMRPGGLSVSFAFGTPDRGSNITVLYRAATKMRGMVTVITAVGY